MAFTIPYLRGVASKVADAFGLSVVDASRIVGYYSLQGDGVGVQGCENLDITIIKAAADSVGVALPGSDHGSKEKKNISVKDHGGGATAVISKTTAKHEKPQKENNSLNNDIKARKTAKTAAKHGKNADVIQNMDIKEDITGINNARGGVSVQGVDASGAGIASAAGVPFNIDIALSIIENFSLSCNLEDAAKMSGGQWSAACMLVGSYIRQHEILIDKRSDQGRGARGFDPDKINSVIDMFAFLCGRTKKAPLITDFLYFAGVSNSWFYNVNGRCVVTSRGIDIKKKLQDLQQAGIASGIVNDRENPTGKIYFSKAILGWSENNNAAPIQEEKTQSVAALPVFGAPDDD